MQLLLDQAPPPLSINVPWRELYAGGAFGQRELADDGDMRGAAKERGLDLGLGQEGLERLDRLGAWSPIAFAAGYASGFEVPAQPLENMRFREEEGLVEWSEYAWGNDEYPTVTPLYSPWQLLCLEDVLSATKADFGVETLLLPSAKRDEHIEGLRSWLERQDAILRSLNERWSALMKLLVALQNRYLPLFTGSHAVIGLPDEGWVFAGRERAQQKAGELLERMGCTDDEVAAVYEFLVERGVVRDPDDGLTMLRRARPRAFHKRWRGRPRHAQDHFDAAQVLWQFLSELRGKPPGRPESWPADSRQVERFELYDRGPATPWTREEVKERLESAELYPPGVYIIGEGESELIVVERLTEGLLDRRAVRELEFFDLRGSGAARHAAPLLQSLSGYVRRAVAIVDNEGQMARYIETAIKNDEIDAENVLLSHSSLEEDNATAAELIALAQRVATNPPPGREPVTFDLDPKELENFHTDHHERSSSKDKRGIAASLIALLEKKTDGRLRLDKQELVEAMAEMLVEEVRNTSRDDFPALLERRPVLGFFVNRIAPVLNRPVPVGRQI